MCTVAPTIPTSSSVQSEDEIDSLLSELDMDLSHFSADTSSANKPVLHNQVEASDSELQDVLRSLLTKEGVGHVASGKKSLQRSMTVGVTLLFFHLFVDDVCYCIPKMFFSL